MITATSGLTEPNPKTLRQRPTRSSAKGVVDEAAGTCSIDRWGLPDARPRIPHLEQAYEMHRELGESIEVSIDLWRFAQALAEVGRPEEAVELASLSASLREELGVRIPWVERGAEKTLADVKEQLAPAAFQEAWERGRRLSPDAAVAMATGTHRS
jgi:hypothetical protein